MIENAKTPGVVAKAPKAPTLYFIVAIKVIKGILLLLVAVGVYALADKDLPDLFDRFLRFVHLDPEGRFFAALGDQLSTITPANVKKAALVPFLYGLFLLVGGTGLALRAKWAIWLAIGESAFFIPIEIFELIRKHIPNPEGHQPMFAHPKIGLSIVLAINVLIVWYLYRNRFRLFRHHD
jgi:uncharacterized membrane protein (DUF2068 family)